MAGIKVKVSGSFGWLDRVSPTFYDTRMNSLCAKYGRKGVQALSARTPVDTGMTAGSWYYSVNKTNSGYQIAWHNANAKPSKKTNKRGVIRYDEVPIVMVIEYGHVTRSGTYVQARPFIDDAVRSIFEEMSDELWKEMTS